MFKKQRKQIDPASFAKNGSEHGEQVALFCAISQKLTEYPELALAFAIPNGGLRDPRTAAALRAEGVKAGVPDIFLPVSRTKYHGFFIELKRPKSEGKQRGYATPEQKEWHCKLTVEGYACAVAIGWEQALDFLIQYLTWKG